VLLSCRHPECIPRLLSIALLMICGMTAPARVQAADEPGITTAAPGQYDYRKTPGLEIRVVGGGWGNVRAGDIEPVLYSVAAVLLEHFPGRRLNAVLVSHSPERPMTLYKKGPANAYQVQLSASGEQWARYAYEFAHEFSHILMNYDHHADAQTATFNQWFEEALCEAASLYALKRLAFVWEFWPPRPQLAAYAPEFERYVERFLNETHRRLAPDVSVAEWFQAHEETLRGRAYLRDHNEVVANLLLPLFEENAALWEAIGYLNLEPKRSTFREYLQTWHDNAPDDYKDTIRYIMALFGVLGPGDAADAAAGEAIDRQPRAPLQPSQPGVAGPPLRQQK
jgi:hypothetical protein